MERPKHWIDDSLTACLEREVNDIPREARRLLINLCGSIRSLERQINEQSGMLQSLYREPEITDLELRDGFFQQLALPESTQNAAPSEEVA